MCLQFPEWGWVKARSWAQRLAGRPRPSRPRGSGPRTRDVSASDALTGDDLNRSRKSAGVVMRSCPVFGEFEPEKPPRRRNLPGNGCSNPGGSECGPERHLAALLVPDSSELGKGPRGVGGVGGSRVLPRDRPGPAAPPGPPAATHWAVLCLQSGTCSEPSRLTRLPAERGISLRTLSRSWRRCRWLFSRGPRGLSGPWIWAAGNAGHQRGPFLTWTYWKQLLWK